LPYLLVKIFWVHGWALLATLLVSATLTNLFAPIIVWVTLVQVGAHRFGHY
jgi:hypothetical protein